MPSSKNYKRDCEFCGVELEHNYKSFCNPSCSRKYFWANRPESFDRTCTVCGDHFKSQSPRAKYCSQPCKQKVQIVRNYKLLNDNPELYFKHLLYQKGREELSVDFMLSLLDKQKGLCAISGQELTFIKIVGNGRVPTNAAIDQIVAGGGYTEDNVQILCNMVNWMKADQTVEEFISWCEVISDYQKGE